MENKLPEALAQADSSFMVLWLHRRVFVLPSVTVVKGLLWLLEWERTAQAIVLRVLGHSTQAVCSKRNFLEARGPR